MLILMQRTPLFILDALGGKTSAGLYILKRKMPIFPLVWKAKKELSNPAAISKAEKFFSYG